MNNEITYTPNECINMVSSINERIEKFIKENPNTKDSIDITMKNLQVIMSNGMKLIDNLYDLNKIMKAHS